MRAWYDAQLAMGLHCVVHVSPGGSVWQDIRDGIQQYLGSHDMAWGYDKASDSPDDSATDTDSEEFESLPWDVYHWPQRFTGKAKGTNKPRWKFCLNANASPEDFVVADITAASKKRHYRPWSQGHRLYRVAQLIIGEYSPPSSANSVVDQ